MSGIYIFVRISITLRFVVGTPGVKIKDVFEEKLYFGRFLTLSIQIQDPEPDLDLIQNKQVLQTYKLSRICSSFHNLRL
jgi:hypothetical protein